MSNAAPSGDKSRVTIYLVSNHVKKDALVKEINYRGKPIEINEECTLYLGKDQESTPLWVTSFFGKGVFENRPVPKSKSSKAVLLVQRQERLFVITFGHGRFMLPAEVFEKRFGLKVTMGLANPDELKSLSKNNMEQSFKLTNEQLGKYGDIREFGLVVDVDLVRGITAKTQDRYKSLGNIAKGVDAISVFAEINVKNIAEVIDTLYEVYISKKYRKHFEWIDNISVFTDESVLAELEKNLADELHKPVLDHEKISLVFPEMIDWEYLDTFKCGRIKFNDDIDLADIVEKILPKKSTLADFLNSRLKATSTNEPNTLYREWVLRKCIYFETAHNSERYIHYDGDWYHISTDFARRIDEEYKREIKKGKAFALSEIHLPEFEQETEKEYNRKAGKLIDTQNLVQELIKNPIHPSFKVEFCDLLQNNNIIHVKNYHGSSVLSHLFNQGYVSGKFLASSSQFRDEVMGKLTKKNKKRMEKFDRREFNIVFAVYSKNGRQPYLPFFSRVTYLNIRDELNLMGYKGIYYVGIKNASQQLEADMHEEHDTS